MYDFNVFKTKPNRIAITDVEELVAKLDNVQEINRFQMAISKRLEEVAEKEKQKKIEALSWIIILYFVACKFDLLLDIIHHFLNSRKRH